MNVPQGKRALDQVVEVLAGFVGVPTKDVHLQRVGGAGFVDAIAEIAGFIFIIEWKQSGAVASVTGAVEQVRRDSQQVGGDAIPLVAVPFMGQLGQERCDEAGVAWLDLSGNARISAPGLRVHVDGRPNRFRKRGRPSNAFAPKSSRIARWLLMHPNRAMNQREIARATDMDEGFTSRIVVKLLEDGLVLRMEGGRIRLRDPKLLLEAWAEDYSFSTHQLIQGHVPARTGDALLQQMSQHFRVEGIQHAATGLAAAWALTRFAGFRLVTMYLEDETALAATTRMGFREDTRGPNVWLVIPRDEGVFQGASDQDGVRCVHPVQAYLDLASHPERAHDAAERVKKEFLNWRVDG